MAKPGKLCGAASTHAMNTTELSLNEIRQRGYAALLKELGPVGYVRFLQQFSPGRGDYTAERYRWLDKKTIDEMLGDIRNRRTAKRAIGRKSRKKS